MADQDQRRVRRYFHKCETPGCTFRQNSGVIPKWPNHCCGACGLGKQRSQRPHGINCEKKFWIAYPSCRCNLPGSSFRRKTVRPPSPRTDPGRSSWETPSPRADPGRSSWETPPRGPIQDDRPGWTLSPEGRSVTIVLGDPSPRVDE